jgi:hypothetical protein
MTRQRRRAYIIQDPYDDDAIRFIDAAFTYFGLRPICFYTDRKGRYYGERMYPVLRSHAVERSYDVELADLERFARTVSRDFEVVGVVPYREDTVEVAAQLTTWLDLDWNTPEVLGRFRDKHSMKSFLHDTSGVRVPVSRFFTTLDELFADELPGRFVIKPNNGFGNQRVGYFSAGDRAAIADHIRDANDQHWVMDGWVMEEFIDGVEYHVDGQVRSDGSVTVVAASQYQRIEANGYKGVYHGEWVCTTEHPAFESITTYARSLMNATGLRRCPFHMELIVDQDGPCMIDLGARLASDGVGQQNSRLHPNRPDIYAMAIHDYLSVNDFATDPIDWTSYDANAELMVYGVSHETGYVVELEGVDEVAADPDFVGWAIPPLELGSPVVQTTELRGTPYIAMLRNPGGDPAAAQRKIDEVHDRIRWSTKKVAPNAAAVSGRARRLSTRVGWELHRRRAVPRSDRWA